MTRCNECGHSDCCGPLRENDVEALQARIAELEGALTAAYQEGWEAGKDTCVVDGDFSHDFKDSSTKALLGGEG